MTVIVKVLNGIKCGYFKNVGILRMEKWDSLTSTLKTFLYDQKTKAKT